MDRVIILVILAGGLAACSTPNERVAQVDFVGTSTLYTTGSLRLVTKRDRGPDYPPVICTEPSPDYAVQFGSEGKAKVTTTQATDTAPAGGEVSGEFKKTETVVQATGRNAGVLALGDGLYFACQSYANGTIGHDAYAMILSQYGALLVSMINGDEATPATATTAGGGAGAVRTAKAAGAGNGRNPTLSALVVACISGHDRTRLRPYADSNTLLTREFCRQVLFVAIKRAARG